MSIGAICSRVVATAWPHESIRVAAQRMADQGVGTLVIVEPDRADRCLGILTDRDITVRAVARQLDPDASPVARVMTTPVQSIDEHAALEEAVSRMANAGTRRLIVTGGDGEMVGILSLDDLLDLFAQEATSIGRLLERQQPRIPA